MRYHSGYFLYSEDFSESLSTIFGKPIRDETLSAALAGFSTQVKAVRN